MRQEPCFQNAGLSKLVVIYRRMILGDKNTFIKCFLRLFTYFIAAHQHREGFQAQGQSSEDLPMKEAFPKADLRAAIEAALTVALSLMVSCPLLNSEKSKHGKGILQVAKEVIQEEIATHIILPLEGILVTLCTGRFSSCDIERAFTQFHSLRLSLDLPLTSNCDPKHKRMFGQMLLRKVFAEAINSIKTGLARANKDPEEVVLTAHDKSVLFYISGYIVKKITPRVPSLQLTCTTLPTSFVKESADWLALVNRGGLKIPRDDFFFLIQELERRHRTFADRKSLSANSLNVVALKEYMMESHLVNFYSERLGCNSYLEAIISIFLTVRGFAITKQLRNKSNSDKKSLRNGLKNKGKNTKAQLH